MTKDDNAENPFDKKESKEPAAEGTNDAKKGPSFLSKANWTPDIVASILATNSGLLLGGALAFLTIYGTGLSLQVFSIALVFFCAWFFSTTCYHMELEGHRHFQQGYLLLIPILGVFITISTISVFVGKFGKMVVGNLAANALPDSIPIPGASDLARGAAEKAIEPIFSKFATFSSIGYMTIAITLAVVAAFTMTAVHRKWLKWYYLLPALLFLGIGALIIASGAAFAKI